MGGFNLGHIQWKYLESITIYVFNARTNQGRKCIRYSFIITKKCVDKVKIHEPLCNIINNQVHFDISVKSESKNKKTYRRNFHKGNYKDMRKYLTKLDWKTC